MQPAGLDRWLLRARHWSAADLRLLLVSDHYPPFIGGAHRQTELLAHELASRGHDVQVATQWHGGMSRREVAHDVVVHRVRQLRTAVPAFVRNTEQRQSPPFPDPVSIRDLCAVLREARPHVVHSYGWLTFSIAAALIGKRVPLIVSARDYGYFCATRTFLHGGRQLCTGPAPGKCLACARTYYGAPKGWIAAAGVAACRPLLRHKLTGVHSVSRYMQDVSAAAHERRPRGPGPGHDPELSGAHAGRACARRRGCRGRSRPAPGGPVHSLCRPVAPDQGRRGALRGVRAPALAGAAARPHRPGRTRLTAPRSRRRDRHPRRAARSRTRSLGPGAVRRHAVTMARAPRRRRRRGDALRSRGHRHAPRRPCRDARRVLRSARTAGRRRGARGGDAGAR